MDYKFEYKYYRRPFRRPLITGHSTWTAREGILVRLENENGDAGYGEIAPLPSFGSESLVEAGEYCRNLNGHIDDDTLTIPDPHLSSCRFALESARDLLRDKWGQNVERKVLVAALLPSGEKALKILDNYSRQGFITFKWKIGVGKIESEQSIFDRLVCASPENAHFRLDANGGLTVREAEDWLRFLNNYNVEFFEQPLPPSETDKLFELAHKYSTPIALDESVASINCLNKIVAKGWSGFLVVKPSIMGSPKVFRTWVEACDCPLIFSSVFETAVGFQAGLQLAAECGAQHYAAGYGTNSCFLNDGLTLHGDGPVLNANYCSLKDFEKIWKEIG